MVESSRRKAFEKKKSKKGNGYEYIFSKLKKEVCYDGDMNVDIPDDTDIDLTKVMQKMQVDKERDESFASYVTDNMTKFNNLKDLL